MKQHDSEKKYFERFAMNLLKKYINIDISTFKNLEKPDWQDEFNSIGIEVTRDSIGTEVTRDSIGTKFWADIEKVQGKKIADKDLKKFNSRFKANGGRIITKETATIIGIKECSFGFNDRYVYIIPSYTDDFKRINKIVIEKTKKLNKNYNKAISDNRLFVFSPILVNPESVEEELLEMKNVQNEYGIKFNIIYICILHKIYIFNIEENNVDIVEMDEEEFNKISIKSSKEIKKNSM